MRKTYPVMFQGESDLLAPVLLLVFFVDKTRKKLYNMFILTLLAFCDIFIIGLNYNREIIQQIDEAGNF